MANLDKGALDFVQPWFKYLHGGGCHNPFGLPIVALTTCTRAAPKVIPSNLLFWPIASESHVGGMSTDVEPFCQYSVIRNVHYRWQQRSSLTQWCLTRKCVCSKGVGLNSFMWKKLHPLSTTDACCSSLCLLPLVLLCTSSSHLAWSSLCPSFRQLWRAAILKMSWCAFA